MGFKKEFEYIEKKSKFYGFLLDGATEEKIKEKLDFLKKEYKKATHICYAYSISSPFSEKAVDDGEPSGTAGRPILSVIQKSGKKDVCVGRRGSGDALLSWLLFHRAHWRVLCCNKDNDIPEVG